MERNNEYKEHISLVKENIQITKDRAGIYLVILLQ